MNPARRANNISVSGILKLSSRRARSRLKVPAIRPFKIVLVFGDIPSIVAVKLLSKPQAKQAITIRMPPRLNSKPFLSTNKNPAVRVSKEEIMILLDKTSLCDVCGGSGAEPGSHVKKCDLCQGTGTVRESRRSILGSFTSLAECSKCRGKGEIPEHFCKHCRGQGVFRKQENINIQIPAGIRDGEAIKLTGMGEALSGGVAGDLYVKINVTPHSVFRREGFDLVMNLYAQPSKMILGGEEAIETLEGPPDGRAGKILVRIPELSKAGDILRLRQKGVPKARGGRGDLLILLHQKLPRKLSSQAKKLLLDLEREGL